MMKETNFSKPLPLTQVQVTDAFWKKEMELVRTEVIPYQWNALNDKVSGAAPSYCMRNYRRAGEIQREKKEKGSAFVPMKYPLDTFETVPGKDGKMDGRFYGFVFQDSDFSKWIEAVAYSLAQHPDPELEKTADEAIAVVCAAQREDGYLDTYYLINDEDQIFSNLKDNHELYCFGHLTEGAVAYYQATGKDQLLHAAMRYADFILEQFGTEEGKKPGYPGHEIAEMALMRLYDLTDEEKYLNLAKYFVNQRGQKPYYFDLERGETCEEGEVKYAYNQAHLPVRLQREAVGHAVRAVYLYSGMADVARATADDELFAACETLWDNIVNQKMYITGGIGATHLGEAFSFGYDLPNDTAYAETCASIGLVFFARRMLEIQAKSKYADVMETALYNGILSGMALDGKSFFYVNPLEVLPEACHKDERKFHVKPIRQKWFGCACCPPNLARLISSIASYAFTEKEDTLFLHLYMGGTLEVEANKEHARMEIQSGFPWDGHVTFTCKNDLRKPYTVAFRLPGWSSVCEKQIPSGTMAEEKDGYLYLTRVWKSGDQVCLFFPMEVCLMASNPLVRENTGRLAVTRGPVVYCMEEADNGKNLHLLELNSCGKARAFETDEMGEHFVRIYMEGRRIVPADSDRQSLYHVSNAMNYEEAALSFLPYYMWNNRGEGEMQVWVRAYQR
ncbi:MAG: glycoside hydrolase family 127 protein [Fusicatenibacter sp.]